MFEGFTKETSDFLWELMFHNERPWFEAHKAEFIRVLKDPFQALAEETFAELKRRYPRKNFQLHVSRIYRDARRLHGRGPYKDHLWFSLKECSGLLHGPSFWFEIGAADYSYGVGAFGADARQMELWRQYVDATPAAVERLARRLNRQKEFRLGGEEYKRPKGDRGELLNPWYNRKWLGIECSHDFGGALLEPTLPQTLVDGYAFLMPYYEMFRQFYREGEERI